MKYLVLVLVLSLHARSASAQEADDWLGADKGLHFTVSYLLGSSGYLVGAALFDSRADRVLTGAVLGLEAGIVKELRDFAGFGTPSWSDLAWGAVGTTVGVAISWLIDIAIDATVVRHSARRTGSPTNR